MKLNVLSFLLLTLLIAFNGCRDRDTEKEAAPVPNCVGYTFPDNLSSVQAGKSINLEWYSTSRVKSYDIYLGAGTTEPVLIAADVLETKFLFEVPEGVGVTYNWYVKPKDFDGNEIACRINPTSFVTQALPELETQQRTVNVLVLNYDPLVSFNGEAGTMLHAIYGWNDPHALAEGYINDVLESSHGLIKYNIVEWRDIQKYPDKKDGFKYDDYTYLDCMFGGNKAVKCHNPDDLDYNKVFQEENIITGIDNGVYEEVWIFGAPYFGFWESCMAGPGSFAINGGVLDKVATKKAFAIMGFSYERGVSEMLHNLCHRSEGTMSELNHGWRAEVLNTSWAKFAANEHQSGTAAVGSCHYPPNAIKDYDYVNSTMVQSSADDWYNYPLMTNTMTDVNFMSWGGWEDGDFQRAYLKWWFKHLPRRAGIAPDGNLNNWWPYIFDFNEEIIKK